MIVIAATLAPITTTVVAREGVAASSGSSHPPGDRFVLSGQDRSSLCAGRLLLETMAPCLARDRLAGERIQRSRVNVTRRGRHRGNEANIVTMSGAAAHTAFGRKPDPCRTAVRRCPESDVPCRSSRCRAVPRPSSPATTSARKRTAPNRPGV